MDRHELQKSISYHSGRTEFSSPANSTHQLGNVYVTDNAIVHLGDSVHSQNGSLVEDVSRLRASQEQQRKTDLQSKQPAR